MSVKCSGCGERFRSVGSFDKHRVGSFTTSRKNKRRCMTREEMIEAGMNPSEKGIWARTVRDTDIAA